VKNSLGHEMFVFLSGKSFPADVY